MESGQIRGQYAHYWEDHGLGKKVNLFNGSQWRDAKIAELTKNAIQQKNEAFVQQHRADTNRDFQYLWRCARTLGRSPSDTEVIGADLLTERFGSWERALEMAKLPKRRSPVPLERSWIYRKEFAYQTEVFQQAREAEKEKRRAANEAVRQENAARLERDALWGEERQRETAAQEEETCREKSVGA